MQSPLFSKQSFFLSSKKTNVFISESFVGNHSDVSFFNADLVSFTFLPTIRTTEPFSIEETKIPTGFRGVWINGKNQLAKNQKIDICYELSISHYKNFIIGTDYDYEGNAMAKLLQIGLINCGVDEENIFRVPLKEDGYSDVTEFWSKDTLLNYIQDKWEDSCYVQKSKEVLGRSGIGRRIAYMITELSNPPKEVKNINPNGTSTITYLFKKAIGEK